MALRSITRISKVDAVRALPIFASTAPTFPSTVLGIWRFDATLEDEVQQNDFVATTSVAAYAAFDKFDLLQNITLARSGLQFTDGKTLNSSANYIYASDWTIAFWWNSPSVLGFTRHTSTKELEPKVAPIIAKSNSSKTSTETHLQDCSFVITEAGYSNTHNILRVYLSTNGSTVSHIIDSEPFMPGLRNILVTYLQGQGRLRIDIDGKTGIAHSGPTTSLQRIGDFVINDIVPGFLAHKTCQEGGYIFDLVFTSYPSLDNESLKFMRYGYEHITFEDLFDTRFVYFGFSFGQPTTISTTQIFVEGGNIFAARSNGEIVKGDQPIWDREFNYPDLRSVSLLTTSELDEGANPIRFVTLTDQGLGVQGATIRI